MIITIKDLENFTNKLENFLSDTSNKAIDLTEKDLKIMTISRTMYLKNKKDKGLQYANKLIMKSMDKMVQNISNCLSGIEN